MKKLAWWEMALVTVLGSGYSPIAPATVASALTCALFWFVPTALRWPYQLFVVPTFFLGVYLSRRAIGQLEVNPDARFRRLRRPQPKKDDPDQDVIDEFVGQWVTLMAVPHNLLWFVAAFIVFRALDIAKPFGIRTVEKIQGGWGVMLDDLLAGLVGALMLVGLRQILSAG